MIIGSSTRFSAVATGGGGFDPEEGLVVSETHIPEAALNFSNFGTYRSKKMTFAMDLVIPPAPVGCLLEHGGSTNGIWVGWRAGGDFIFRAGESEDPPGDGGALVVLSAGKPTGSGTLVVTVDRGPDGVRAWWNGILLGQSDTVGGLFISNAWTSGDLGKYLGVGGSNVTSPESSTAFNGVPSSQSDLRVYIDQTPPI